MTHVLLKRKEQQVYDAVQWDGDYETVEHLNKTFQVFCTVYVSQDLLVLFDANQEEFMFYKISDWAVYDGAHWVKYSNSALNDNFEPAGDNL